MTSTKSTTKSTTITTAPPMTSITTKRHATIRASRTKSHFHVLHALWLTWCGYTTFHIVLPAAASAGNVTLDELWRMVITTNSRATEASSIALLTVLASAAAAAAAVFVFQQQEYQQAWKAFPKPTLSSLVQLRLVFQLLPTVLASLAHGATCYMAQSSALRAMTIAAEFLFAKQLCSALFAGFSFVEKSSPGQQFEDAVTLTSFLLIVCEWTALSKSSNNYTVGNEYCTGITMWACFKMVRLAMSTLRQVRTTVRRNKRRVNTTTAGETIDSNIWIIRGVQYDVSSFVDSHPGGKEAILLGQGREDCTALFESYHPFAKGRPFRVLQQYRLDSSVDDLDHDAVAAAVDSKHDDDDKFYAVLVKAVEQTLRKKYDFDPVRDRAATPQRVLYYAVIWIAVAICGVAHCQGSILGSFLLAFPGWLIGALGHDGGHFAVSRQWPILNDVAVWGMSFLSNPIVWQHQHTFAHHSHTNSLHQDPDLHHFVDILRLHRGVKQQGVFRNQSSKLYVIFAYTLVIVGTCFFLPWQLIQEGSLYSMVEWTDRKRLLRTMGMYLHLLLYTAVIVILPFFVHTTPAAALLAGVSHIAASGVLFATFSQIGHLNEASLDPDAFAKRQADRGDDKRGLNASWAVHQIETSNNFCPTSAMWHVLSNGLNLQIEHHLFPGLNHCHLHLIQPTVQAVCKEYGVCYKSYDSWNDLMGATLDWLHRLAVEPELAVVDGR